MSNDTMSAEEIVRGLRKWGAVLRDNHRGFNPQWQVMFAAAALIEAQAAEISELRAQFANYQEVDPPSETIYEQTLREYGIINIANLYECAEHREAAIRAQLTSSQQRERAAVEIVRCKDCRWKDTAICRASKSIKYDLRREKHTYQTCMEPDGFCSIGERGLQEAGEENR